MTRPHLGEPGRRHTELQTEDRQGEDRCWISLLRINKFIIENDWDPFWEWFFFNIVELLFLVETGIQG